MVTEDSAVESSQPKGIRAGQRLLTSAGLRRRDQGFPLGLRSTIFECLPCQQTRAGSLWGKAGGGSSSFTWRGAYWRATYREGANCHKKPANQCKETGIACQTTSLPTHRAKERRTAEREAAQRCGRVEKTNHRILHTSRKSHD